MFNGYLVYDAWFVWDVEPVWGVVVEWFLAYSLRYECVILFDVVIRHHCC